MTSKYVFVIMIVIFYTAYGCSEIIHTSEMCITSLLPVVHKKVLLWSKLAAEYIIPMKKVDKSYNHNHKHLHVLCSLQCPCVEIALI